MLLLVHVQFLVLLLNITQFVQPKPLIVGPKSVLFMTNIENVILVL